MPSFSSFTETFLNFSFGKKKEKEVDVQPFINKKLTSIDDRIFKLKNEIRAENNKIRNTDISLYSYFIQNKVKEKEEKIKSLEGAKTYLDQNKEDIKKSPISSAFNFWQASGFSLFGRTGKAVRKTAADILTGNIKPKEGSSPGSVPSSGYSSFNQL